MITAIVNNSRSFKIVQKPDGLYADNERISWNMVEVDKNCFHVIQDHTSYTIEVISRDIASKSFAFKINNKKTVEVVLKDRFDDLLHELGMDAAQTKRLPDIKAPMPGLVVEVKVQSGQSIKKGDAILVLEAMKMENILKATGDGVVKSILVQKGSKVEKNEILVMLQ